MSEKKPENADNLQMTPVGFSPPSDDALGTVGAKIPFREMQFPVLIPVSIILLTLIYSTVRDIGGFNRRLADIDARACE